MLEADGPGGNGGDARTAPRGDVAGELLSARLRRHDGPAGRQSELPPLGHALGSFFVVRVLADPDVPPRAGAPRPSRFTAPPGWLVNAQPPAAVAAGNVETSSRVVDVVMRAFGEAIDVPAQGQGTMNNVTLGNDRFTYYETIGGGQGACPEADGPSGVHVAMSNTLYTPVEALELQYPLRVERYALRLGSGGAGGHRGGDGVVRELRVLEDCRLSIISERRSHAPAGRAWR